MMFNQVTCLVSCFEGKIQILCFLPRNTKAGGLTQLFNWASYKASSYEDFNNDHNFGLAVMFYRSGRWKNTFENVQVLGIFVVTAVVWKLVFSNLVDSILTC